MGVNIKFTVAVIAIGIIGFIASSYFFSTQSLSSDWMFDKSKYIQEIDACLEFYSMGDVSLNSFGKSFVTSLKQEAEAAQSEEKIKEIMDRLYDVTNCEP